MPTPPAYRACNPSHKFNRPLFLLALLTGGLFCFSSAAQDSKDRPTAGDSDVTPAQIKALIDQAGDLFKQKEMTTAGEKIKAAQSQLDQLLQAGLDANQLYELRPSYSRLKRAHELLTQEGIQLDPLNELPKTANKNSKTRSAPADRSENSKSSTQNSDSVREPADESDAPSGMPSDTKSPAVARKSTVSFTKQIAPLLMRSCGNCHVLGNRGNINFANYQTLLDHGLVEAGNPDLSDLFTVVDDGTMPPQRKLSSNDKKLIKTWITEGASFDGEDQDREKGLATYAAGNRRR